MAKREPPLNGWVLRTNPDTVRMLERDSSGTMVLVGDSEKLKLNDVKLLVPRGIYVYDVVGDYRSASQFFFTTRGDGLYDPAYLSIVKKHRGKLHSGENIGRVLEYPWFNRENSAFIFNRLITTDRNAPLYARKPQTEQHPLYRFK